MTELRITGSEVDAWDKCFHHAFGGLIKLRKEPPDRDEDQWSFLIEHAAILADQMIIVRRLRLPELRNLGARK